MIASRLALAAAALLAAACAPPREPEAFKTVPISPFLGAPVIGDKAAPVEIVEFASTTCSHCKAFHDEVFPTIKTKYIDTGKARLVWSVMPTPPASVSMAGAALARCAGEDKFFAVIDDLFANQDQLVEATREPWQLQKNFRDLGARHGLNADQVGTCIDDKAINSLTRKGVQDAPAFVTGTPAFTIDREELKEESLAGMEAAIDAALAKTRPSAPDPLAPKPAPPKPGKP